MSQAEAGKGSKPRPFSVSHDEWSNRWDAIFRRDGLDEEPKKEVDKNKQPVYNTEKQKD